MRTVIRALLVTALLVVPGVSQAAGDDHNGFTEIMKGDLGRAERMLVAEHKMFPEAADLSLNLAAIYAGSGRIQQARALYADVLARPNESMVMQRDRTAWSHEIATLGLQRLRTSELTAR